MGKGYVAISELADINPSVDLKSLSPTSKVSFTPMADVSEKGIWWHRQERMLKDVRAGFTPFAEDDLLFAKITPCMENGKGAHVSNLKNAVGFGSTEFHVLRAKSDNSPRFLFHWLQAQPTRTRALAFMGGSAGQQRVQAEFFRHYEVPYFDPQEQSRTAYVLDTIDEAIQKTEAVIAKLKQIRAGMLHDLLTYGLDKDGKLRDPVAHPEQFKDSELGRIPKEWDDPCGIRTHLTHTIDYRGSTPPYTDTGVPAISAENIGDGRVRSITKFVSVEVYRRTCTRGEAEPADVIVTMEAPVGEVALLPGDCTYRLTRRVIGLRSDESRLRKKYLFLYLYLMSKRKDWARFYHGSTVPRMLKPDLLGYPIALPGLAEQDAIVVAFESCESSAENAYLKTLRFLNPVRRPLTKSTPRQTCFENCLSRTWASACPQVAHGIGSCTSCLTVKMTRKKWPSLRTTPRTCRT